LFNLAKGDREVAALLVAINSIVQVLAYALLGNFYLKILPNFLGLDAQSINFSFSEIAKAVFTFLASHWWLVIMFSLQGQAIISNPFQVSQVALPLFICFVVKWLFSSKQALAGVIGPLIEVPVLVALVYLCLLLRPNFKK